MKYFRNITLRIKLLGIYFAGLVVLGVIGYGFFVILEINNYRMDSRIFGEQAKFFEQKSFNHMKYTMELHNILNKLYRKVGDTQVAQGSVVEEFISNVAVINDESYVFALFNEKGKLITTNGNIIKNIIDFNIINQKKVMNLFKDSFNEEIRGEFIEFDSEDDVQGYFMNSMFFEPLGYYIITMDKTDKAQKNIDAILAQKRQEIIKAVSMSVMLGLMGTIFVVGVLYFYLRSMTRNIDNITTSINALASSGQTGHQLISKNADEIGRMIAAFNKYLKKRTDLEKFKKLIEEDEYIEDVYCRIFALMETLDIKDFAVYEIEESKNKMVHISGDVCPDTCVPQDMPCSQDILVNADACRAKRLAHVVTGDVEYHVCPKFNGYSKGYSHMCVPIIIGGIAGEIVHVTIKKDSEDTLKSALPVLAEYLKNAAPVIESKKLLQNLRETTLRDAMTGLNNRRFLEEYTEILIADARRKKNNMAILMCDLDYFKKVNDVHGHEAGDKVLKMLSDIMRGSVRSSDIVIRYGGEEFLIIVKDCVDDISSMEVAEKIRKNVQDAEMRVSPTVLLNKTISIGVSMFPLDTENFWQAIKYADVALYRAKEDGRNRVIRFDPTMWKDSEGDY